MSYFHHFQEDISEINLPAKFTFPFYYEPHPLAIIAAKELQQYLENQTDFKHDFGFSANRDEAAKGKMFGVLVVKNSKNEIGYLTAFSGTLADKSLPGKFVPPLFNMHEEDSFYLKGEDELNALNQQIRELEENPQFIALQKSVESKTLALNEEITRLKERMRKDKKIRKESRFDAGINFSPEAYDSFIKQLEKESFVDRYFLKNLTAYRKEALLPFQKELEGFTNQLAKLKAERKRKSAHLQQKLHDQYQFLNQQKKTKALTDIFPVTQEQKPPGGAGDCSAPKLLQYAFSHDLEPIVMAEFWWGASPKKEIRKHKNYYPACRGRCKPILDHMLDGIEMDESPLLRKSAEKKEIEVIYEDDALLVINKPTGLLTIPGKEVSDSVYTRMLKRFPKAKGSLIVHRLDMATSGILVITKTKKVHKILQSQFLKRTVKKRYTALLDGNIAEDEGYIDLPLRVDLDDRPRQLVCYEYGKPAKTKWKVVERLDGKTRVHFYPITGRTHQLRVHAAHPSGLNTPIVGDDLYGQKADRLHLHAEFIQFIHPITQEKMRFTIKADF